MCHRPIMLSSVLFVIIQLCSLQLMVVSSPVHLPQGVLVTCAHHCLRDLRGPFPVHCIKYNANISFPDSVFPAAEANHKQCPQVSRLVYESLEGAWNVFENYNIMSGEDGLNWDEAKFDNFQNFQVQLLEEGRRFYNLSSDLLASYFDNVTAVLQQQDSATCGWEALRRDLLRVLRLALQKYHHCFTWRDSRSTVTSSMC